MTNLELTTKAFSMVTYESDRSRFNFMLYLGVIKRTKVYFKNVNFNWNILKNKYLKKVKLIN